MSALVVLASLVLGGGSRQGFAGDAALQLIAIPLLIAVFYRWLTDPREKKQSGSGPFVAAALICGLPLLQLVPLPPDIWTKLPGRAVIVENFGLTGQPLPWLPLSVSPSTTWLSVLSLLPPIALFLGVSRIPLERRRALSLLFLAGGVVSVFLGLLQVAQGPASALRFYAVTNPSEPVGFFANRNHFAALLYSLIVIAFVWAAKLLADSGIRKAAPMIQAAMALLAITVFLAGELMARSRMGLGLTILALLFCWPLARGFRNQGADPPQKATAIKLLLAAGVVGVLLLTQFLLYRVAERFAFDPLADQRVQFARNTWAAAKSFMPFGSGTGTFVQAYGLFDKPEDLLANSFANRAHNDALELLLESGAAGLALAILFGFWFLRRSIAVWRSPSKLGYVEPIDAGLARAGSVVITLLLLHSMADYPLRTAAMMAVFSFAAGLLVPAPTGRQRHGTEQDLETSTYEARSDTPTPSSAPGALVVGPAQPQSGATQVERWGEDVPWPDSWSKQPSQNAPEKKE